MKDVITQSPRMCRVRVSVCSAPATTTGSYFNTAETGDEACRGPLEVCSNCAGRRRRRRRSLFRIVQEEEEEEENIGRPVSKR